jgi:AraC-like DNA-binding protein
MDLLTDILRDAGLRRRLLDLRRLSADVALRFPCERSIGLHVVTQGRVHVHAPTLDAPLALGAGDIAVMARGCVHLMSVQADATVLPVQLIGVWDESQALAAGSGAHTGTTGAATTGAAVVSGAYQFWNPPLHPLFAEMPAWFVLRADELPKLGPLALAVGLLGDEMRDGGLGAETVVHRLLDVVFTYLLREMVVRLGEAGRGFAHAVRDAQVRRAVTLLHGDPAHAWTLPELAARAGLSRTTLAERFRTAMGDTPLAYLRTLRMQKAMRLLGETEKHLEAVATEVGYQDAFGFSKVFKRTLGISPREYRRQEQAGHADPWRFQAG